MTEITGELFNTSWGKAIVHNEQDIFVRKGDEILFEGRKYVITAIVSSSRPNGRWSLIVKDYE